MSVFFVDFHSITNMDPTDWKHELNHMLDTIEKQSASSLEKINQHFDEFGLPFDDEFRQHVVKAASLRYAIQI